MRGGDDRNVTYRRHRYRSQEPPQGHREEGVLGEEGVAHSEAGKGKDHMGEEEDPRIGSLFQMMNNLAKGQKMMMDLLGQLELNTIEGQPKTNQNGERGSNNGEGLILALSCRATLTYTPRPTMPQFLSGEVAPEGPTG
jgi:hypothetical protein